MVRFSDFPSCSSCRLLAAPCCVVHVELGQKVAASTCEWWAKMPATYGAWSLRVGDGAWLQQGRCCKVWCGGETRDGRVLWCYDGRQRWCAGQGEGGRGTEYLRLHGPILPTLRADLRSSPSVWRTAAQCPPSRRTQAAMTNHRSCSPCGRYGSWNRPPGCEQAMERSKEKTRTARRVETEWSASCPTALPDHADLPDSSSPPRCSGATVCRSSAPVRQAEQDGSGREKVMISQTPQKRNIAMPCAVDPRVSFSARPESRWPAAVPAAEAVRMRRPWCLLVWG